jgi:pyrimidine-nucleoside phosphorylase
MKKHTVAAKKSPKPSFNTLIEKKRDGGEFSQDEIRHIVDAIADGELPEPQQAALAMAIYFQGLSAQEMTTMADEMMLSGDVMDLSELARPKIDRYSTGGIGDKTQIVLGPLAAACGVIMPTLSSSEEDFIIGNLEKLCAIPGFSPQCEPKHFVKTLKTVGHAYMYQPAEVAPVERMLYELRQNTGTLQSLPLITAGLLGKKMAEGAEGLVVDIKWGNGSMIKDLEQAKQLARLVARVGRSMKRRCVAMVTDMNQPLGDTVGTALEVQEAIALLKGQGPAELQDFILKVGMEIVRLAGVAGSTLSAKQIVTKHLQEGTALQKFKDMVKAQGGDTSYIDNPDKFPKAKYVRKLPAPKRGYVHTINASMIARGVRLLGEDAKGVLDPAVGVSAIQKVGNQVKQSDPLMMIHYNSETQLEQALECFRSAYRLAPKRPNPIEILVERLA